MNRAFLGQLLEDWRGIKVMQTESNFIVLERWNSQKQTSEQLGNLTWQGKREGGRGGDSECRLQHSSDGQPLEV